SSTLRNHQRVQFAPWTRKIARHKPLAKAAAAPKIAPHPADLPTMLLMFYAPRTSTDGLSEELPSERNL
ncbi:MAG: hypothetical protein WA851_17335, partial [Xanthobacteraceae bacterium]